MKFFARFRRRTFKYLPVISKIFAAICFLIVLFFAYWQLPSAVKLLGLAAKVIIPQDQGLKAENGKINILILGIGGANHDGPNLSDTIMVLTIPASGSGNIYITSIPRDIYIESLGDKINSAYGAGEAKRSGAGLVLAKAVVGQVTGLPIQYGISLDFDAFTQVINLLGGVDINVENTFDDYQYPIAGREDDLCNGDKTLACRYTHVHFEKGLNHMDGTIALEYIRSRHAQGDEGTDFARNKRQQNLVTAVKQKALTLNTLLDFKKTMQIYETLKMHITTDIEEAEFNAFFKLGLKLRNSPIKNIVLDENYFYNPPIDERGWILLPTGGNFDLVHRYIKESLY